ncbi:squalene synthase HpnD [Rickettsiales bacterium Ac37b]|nr:squalene synthase HpnD [Rickettsiales bacterium Ac37b]
MVNISLSYPAVQVKNFDNDRYLCSLFTPSSQMREQLFIIYAFNIELNFIKHRVNDEMLAMIRLEWWRETIEDIYLNKIREHPIVKPLAEVINQLSLDKEILINRINAEEYSLGINSLRTMDNLYQYIEFSSLPIFKISLDILGNTNHKIKNIIKDLAIVWSIIDIIKSIKPHMLAKNILIPEEVMNKHGIAQYMILEPIYKENVKTLIAELVEIASIHLKQVYSVQNLVSRELYAVFLMATLSQSFIKRIKHIKYNIFDYTPQVNRLKTQLILLMRVLIKEF